MLSCPWFGLDGSPPTVLSVASQRAAREHRWGGSEQRHCSNGHRHRKKRLSSRSLCFSRTAALPTLPRESSAPRRVSLACLNTLALLYIVASLGAMLNRSVAGLGGQAFMQRNHSNFTIRLQDGPPCTGGCWSRPSPQPASAPRRGIKELAQPAPGPPGSCLLMPLRSPALGSPFPPYKYSIVLAKTYCTREQGMFQRIPETGSLC